MSKIPTESQAAHRGIRTGFVDLDKLLIGLAPQSITIVAGGASVGKTAMALALVQHVALDQNSAIGLCSPGSTRQKIRDRLLLATVPITSSVPPTGQLSPADREHFVAAESALAKAPIWVDDSPRVTTTSLRMAGRRAKLQGEVTCLIVDDLHLLYDPHGGSRHEHWCNVSRVLKAMAFELQLPVVAFLRLDLPEPAKTHCGLDALCDFGSIAQDADIILLLAKSDHVNASGPTHGTMDHVHVSVAKNRHGQTGLMKLGLNAPTGALTSWSAGTNTLWATEFKEQ